MLFESIVFSQYMKLFCKNPLLQESNITLKLPLIPQEIGETFHKIAMRSEMSKHVACPVRHGVSHGGIAIAHDPSLK